MDVLRLDVFGMIMVARRSDHGWQLSIPGNEGKSQPVYEIVIPSDIVSTEELIQLLNDVYHESATPERPSVKMLNDND